jgi:two-component system, OmpR family, phosphate regulon response regulator OmpR
MTPRPARAPLADEAPHLLVVDDDRRIRELLSRFLSDQGLRVTTAASAAEARARMEALVFDAVILDVMMPGETGLEFLRRLRDEAGDTVPVIMLTARSEVADRIAGLEAGADDYLPKPFDPRELLLRVTNILKRAAPPPSQTRPEMVRFGPFLFLLDRQELRRGDEVIRLTDRERVLLGALAEAAGETVSRFSLVGPDGDASERAVDVQINRLRRKIEKDPANPAFVQTVRGVGYKLVTA